MLLLTHILIAAVLAASSTAAASTAGLDNIDNTATVTVRFYGEAQCPFCRKWVEEVWPLIWNDKEMMAFIDYDFVPWGNAYFATTMCGKGPYDSQERACFYDHCITSAADDGDACFGGDAIYQHSEKEGQVDIYETCILKNVGLDAAVAFTFCAEGPDMDNDQMSALELLKECAPDGVDPKEVQACLESQGKKLEIENAKKTPVHPGVPYVVVDGKPLEGNPFTDTQDAICKALKQKGATLPKACSSKRSIIPQQQSAETLSY